MRPVLIFHELLCSFPSGVDVSISVGDPQGPSGGSLMTVGEPPMHYLELIHLYSFVCPRLKD